MRRFCELQETSRIFQEVKVETEEKHRAKRLCNSLDMEQKRIVRALRDFQNIIRNVRVEIEESHRVIQHRNRFRENIIPWAWRIPEHSTEVRSLDSPLQLEEENNGTVDVSRNKRDETKHGRPNESSTGNNCGTEGIDGNGTDNN